MLLRPEFESRVWKSCGMLSKKNVEAPQEVFADPWSEIESRARIEITMLRVGFYDGSAAVNNELRLTFYIGKFPLALAQSGKVISLSLSDLRRNVTGCIQTIRYLR